MHVFYWKLYSWSPCMEKVRISLSDNNCLEKFFPGIIFHCLGIVTRCMRVISSAWPHSPIITLDFISLAVKANYLLLEPSQALMTALIVCHTDRAGVRTIAFCLSQLGSWHALCVCQTGDTRSGDTQAGLIQQGGHASPATANHSTPLQHCYGYVWHQSRSLARLCNTGLTFSLVCANIECYIYWSNGSKTAHIQLVPILLCACRCHACIGILRLI